MAPLNKLRAGRPVATPRFGNYSATAMPLETLVEADDIHAAPTARMRVRAGQHFERLLAARNLGQYVGGFRTAYPIAATPDPGDTPSRRFLAMVAGRAIDGEKLYRDLKTSLRATPPALPAAPAIPAADSAAVIAAAQAWVAWADALVFTGSGAPAGWVPDRLEYAFGASSPDGITLEADEYSDGRLDWHAFDATGTPTTPPAGRSTLGPVTVVPGAVTYPGMPASRLWEFEDGRVNFGAVEAQPEDLGRLLLSGFGLVYGADWLLVPLEVAVGTLVRITRLDVRDTFGRTVTVGPTAPAGDWGMFGLSRADGPPDGALLLAPTLAASVQGRDLEEVLLLRDETANLAWAVERTTEGEDGRPADRAQAAYEAVPLQAAAGGRRHAALPPAHRPAAALVPAHAPARAALRPVDELSPGRHPARAARRARHAAAPPRPPTGPHGQGPEAHAPRGRGPARGRPRDTRLPTDALDRRHHAALAWPAQERGARRGLQRPALRHGRAARLTSVGVLAPSRMSRRSASN